MPRKSYEGEFLRAGWRKHWMFTWMCNCIAISITLRCCPLLDHLLFTAGNPKALSFSLCHILRSLSGSCNNFSWPLAEDYFPDTPPPPPLQWGAADAEIKVPSVENTELKRSPFKTWSRSVCSHTCYAYCQGFLPCLFLPFRSIHLHFFENLPRFFLCRLWLTHSSCVGL